MPVTEKPKVGQLCRLAVALSQQPEFFDYISKHTEFQIDPTKTRIFEARRYILEVCGIDSRKRLDADKFAAGVFHERIRRPYLKHMGLE